MSTLKKANDDYEMHELLARPDYAKYSEVALPLYLAKKSQKDISEA